MRNANELNCRSRLIWLSDPLQSVIIAIFSPNQAVHLPSDPNTMGRKILSSGLLTASFLVSAIVLVDAVVGLLRSDAEVVEYLQGAAYEDVLGLGFWPLLSMIVVLQVVLIGTSRVVHYHPRFLSSSIIVSLISLLLWAVDNHRIEALFAATGST